MWYVIQTLGGEEERTVDMIRKRVPSYYIEDCFIPKRERLKKFHGRWNKVEEILFPGYVFVISEQPEELYQSLQRIPKLTRILGREENYFIPLSELEKHFFYKIGNKEHKTCISKVELEEGKIVRVIDGPLKDFIGNVVKMNFHKKEVAVRAEFMGSLVELYMGVEIVERQEG